MFDSSMAAHSCVNVNEHLTILLLFSCSVFLTFINGINGKICQVGSVCYKVD